MFSKGSGEELSRWQKSRDALHSHVLHRKASIISPTLRSWSDAEKILGGPLTHAVFSMERLPFQCQVTFHLSLS